MTDTDRGLVSDAAAIVYEEFFVPALFAQWTSLVLDAAAVAPGANVLDVGCGTGVLARAALGRVGAAGSVTGVDPNEGMLAVARRKEPRIRWEHGVAEDLPFPDGAFDHTVSQFALMFSTDPASGLREMARVTASAGRVAVAVWASLDENPGYARLAALLDQLFGPEAGAAERAPFHLGERGVLEKLGSPALADPTVTAHHGVARFASLDSWLHTEVRGWTLADAIDDEGFDALVTAAESELGEFIGEDGVTLPVSALILSGSPA